MKTIKLNDIISDWDNYRLECMENMFYQFHNNYRLSALKESADNYKFAINKYSELYLKRMKMRKESAYNLY